MITWASLPELESVLHARSWLLAGFGVPGISAPSMALNMPLPSGPGTAFQAVHPSKSLLAGHYFLPYVKVGSRAIGIHHACQLQL